MQENSSKNKCIGGRGEELAVSYLLENGFEIIARNVRYKLGEIDIVARRKRKLFFVEVKTRTDPYKYSPLEAITDRKKLRMRRLAQMYLKDYRNNFKNKDAMPCYLSVIAVDFSGVKPEIECILDAVD